MKKIIVSFLLLMTGGLSVVFAGDLFNPSQRVLDEFKKEFNAAQSVSWEKEGDYDRATFVLGTYRVIAWFNPDGQLEGSARDISFEQVPMAVMSAVDKKFTDRSILTVREISNADGTSYRIILAARNKKFKIRVDSAGNINEVEKITK